MSLGSINGGRAELIPATDTRLAIAEGVETALAAHILLGIPAWACCGSFPDSFDLPDRVRSVTIVADHDASGGSQRRAKMLHAFFRSTGRDAQIIKPISPGDDANDVLVIHHGDDG